MVTPGMGVDFWGGRVSQNTVEVIRLGFGFCDEKVIFEAANDALIADVERLKEQYSLLVTWIGQFKPGETLYDIGAGSGAGAILAAKSHGVRVLAFEADAQKFALLNRNICLNQLQAQVVAYCLTVSAQSGLGRLSGEPLNQQGTVYQCLDTLVDGGIRPPPQHIKITVGENYQDAIAGMTRLLASSSLQSVFIRFDVSMKSSQDLIAMFNSHGFYCYDRIRKYYMGARIEARHAEGPSSDGEPVRALPECHIFARDTNRFEIEGKILKPLRPISSEIHKRACEHVIETIRSAQVVQSPYCYCKIDNLFPDDFYQQLMKYKPTILQMTPIPDGGTASSHYQNRFSLELEDKPMGKLGEEQRQFIEEFTSWILGEEVLLALLNLYKPFIQQQNIKNVVASTRGLFTKDLQGYSIAPHTDTMIRLITGVLYLPNDRDHPHLGTSVYEPKKHGFECDGTRHHVFENFDLLNTACYKPNSALFFLRSMNSFHGVEPITEDYERDCMIYVLKKTEIDTYH